MCEHIEDLHEGERWVDSICISRKYIVTHCNKGVVDSKMFLMHTNVRDTSIADEQLHGTMAIVHGFAENSDVHLESAMQYALNGFDVQLIDLRGYGMSGGFRMTNNWVHDYHYDVASLLKQSNPLLPLFLYGHSMGGLAITTFLLNNPALKISGVILSAPFLNFHENKAIDEQKRFLVNAMAPHLEVTI